MAVRHRDPGVAQLLLQHRDAGGIVAVLALGNGDPRIEVGGLASGGRAAEISADRADIFGIGLGQLGTVGGTLGSVMPGGTTAACIPDPAYPPPCPPVVVVHAAAASDTNANRSIPRASTCDPPSVNDATAIARESLWSSAHERELSGQVAIVTGGASGIGAASAALLEGQGARVITADIQDAKDGAGRFVAHDVTSEESWKALLADVLGSEGRLDIMVNNAGISGGMRQPRDHDRRATGSTCRRSIPKACSSAASTPSRA